MKLDGCWCKMVWIIYLRFIVFYNEKIRKFWNKILIIFNMKILRIFGMIFGLGCEYYNIDVCFFVYGY